MSDAPPDLLPVLLRLSVVEAGETPVWVPLDGGVSSDIWRVGTARGVVCVKRARARLKVAADWFAPIERNAFEVSWFETAGRIVPEAVPRVIAHDPAAGLFVMDYLPPASHRLWKDDLRQGRVEPAVAAAVGRRLAAIHAGTAGDAAAAARFATDRLFRALRLEPYLEATARAHPDRAEALAALAATTAGTRLALVHGDVSPKNILIGPRGPVFLDAECAWYGDPAFDLAFCLNHLLLKCRWVPSARERLRDAGAALAESYLTAVTWEPVSAIEGRAARLVPALMLARVDGTSPVEYLSGEDRVVVRRFARGMLARPVHTLTALVAAWQEGDPG
jgi:aminoglycoside phosphotransferase (APT) family kinase protein